ncbi:MAG: ComF family protein [Candidatus Altimarinota bacterium]
MDGLFYLQFYREKSVLIKALFELKYEFRKGFAEVLGEEMIRFWKEFLMKWSERENLGVICLMPMHERKLKKRGFNQMELIWEGMVKKMPGMGGWRRDLLIKSKNTKAQMSLGAEERKINAEGSLGVSSFEEMPEKVLIMDDIGTSLSTLNEASKVLKAAGVQKVYALVLARQILE